ncbi:MULTISPECIES: 16S rRNA (cytosine(1402)-N(4))-methyltransferase RsmH [Tsukamurella]|uniref:Ribosomal RNA small subunit methyltransferase H n=1 Tax=Tsukamurella strandjordii TaxID=147577 RepID=A0AA90NRJ9_9ACTN|nr:MULTISPECIES: 16S rRNA (cytosine(1402)-N(4))-methyltransferase RsmH [Tsukamurella]MDP0399484.1 16S rRNA (cytosine(1402)-N(4))-methyltransferase RsmH [Tsukamurella strandjordii]GIZ95659.1 ribosomal RNA small subunit methyltransferase H [Tsukamurella sp. TY48]
MPESGEDYGHVPVLATRVRELLAPALAHDGAVYVDATLGAGGHSELILDSFPAARVIGLDRDTDAHEIAGERLARFGDRFTAVHTRYDGIADALDDLGIAAVDAVLFDLGVSSMQLDRAERGFAYSVDAPLDMRMNADDPLTAADVLNTYSHGDLARILQRYGDERFAGKIASAVLKEREKEPFTTSGRLVELLYATIPAPARRTGGHPAKRTFQALRIEVNAELASLESAVPQALDALAPDGRIVFLSYQSLEDKIVKAELAARTRSTTPAGLPMDLPGTGATFELLTRGAERATEEEIAENQRAAPVRMRAARRLTTDPQTHRRTRSAR